MSSALKKLRIPDDITRLIRGLHPEIKKKIRFSFDLILQDSFCGKALKDEFHGLRSFRVGHFRIIYRPVEEKPTEIIAIGPRKSIYSETYRRLFSDPRHSV